MTDPTAVIVETLEVVQIESTEVGLQGPPGINGPTDHGALTGLGDDGHLQYHTDARGDARYSGLAHAHTGVYEPANANLQSHVSSTANPHSVTAAQAGADASGTAAGLIASHEAAANPHPGYLTPTEGDAAYAALGHAHTGVYDPAGTAASAVSAHAGGTDVHAIASVTGLQGALDGKSATSHDHAATYAPLASGVTHGDSHDHSGGDGAQISYANLSNLPTLGTAAATAATDYATASHNHTGTYVATGADAADLSSSTATDGYVLTADGAGGAAWEAAAVTYAGAASEIHAATDKATPVDADELGLVDSAASWGLKKLSWANLKTTLSSVFAVLAGKSGGQTLIGGTGVTDKLTLQGTSGNGTSTATAVEVKVGDNGGTSALTVLNNGDIRLTGTSITTSGTMLKLTQTGDIYGETSLSILHRNGYNGALFSNNTSGPAKDLVDFVFKPSYDTDANNRNIRLEARTPFTKTGQPEFTIGDPTNPSLIIGYHYLCIPLNRALGINFTSAPSACLQVLRSSLINEQLRLGYDISNYASFTVDSLGNLTVATTGSSPSIYTATLRSGVKVTAATTTASPSATDTGTVYTNEGDADGATILLPTAVAGLQFTVYVQTAQTLTLTANSGDTIRIANSVTAAAGSITSNVVGSSVTLVAINSTEWVATSSVGSWSV